MQKDCRTWARACQSCQRSKIMRHTVTPLGDFTLPAARFLYIHIDLIGHLPTSAGFNYCPTAVDQFHALAGSLPYTEHHGRHRGARIAVRLDSPLRLPTNHHDAPGAPI